MKLHYFKEYHKKLPHIVKFSGGRSSGFLLLNMLERGYLNSSRGDVVIFNNTSAEHPKTYEFVRKCKYECEKYDIPFFILEFQTYEDCKNGIYNRFKTYRLVNEFPYSEENPNGYRHKGEVFEEMVSWQMYLPNVMSRICTKNLKTDVTEMFLDDWLLGFSYIDQQGHYGKSSRILLDELYAQHIRNGGGVPFEIFKKKKEYVLNCPIQRKKQYFKDFTKASINNQNIYVNNEIEYNSFIGFRYDEPHRIERMLRRNNLQKEEISYIKEKNEHIYMPLIDNKITQKEIKEFWDGYKWDLGLPYDGTLGNCVFCFMKGNKLYNIKDVKNEFSPLNIDWWIYMEEKYQRDLLAEGREKSSDNSNDFVNFFGVDKNLSYKKIKENRK